MQLFLTFESHVIRDEGEQREGVISRRFNVILFWQHLRGGYMPSGLGMAHGEKKKVPPSHHDRFSLGQLGGHGRLTLTAIAYKQEGMAWQR